VISKPTSGLYSSSNESSQQLHSLPTYSSRQNLTLVSQVSYVDPMNQSYTSVRSVHSDSSATTSLINTKSSTRNVPNITTSLTSSLHLPRKRVGHHRRNTSGIVSRDRNNSLTKSDQQKLCCSLSQQEQEQPEYLPLVRNIEAVLNEHLIMINSFLLNYSFNASIQYPSQNSSIRDFIYTRLNELSEQNPMRQRCSRVETKAFIDLITSFQMNRGHHYSFLNDSVKDLLITTTTDPICFSTSHSENDDDIIKGENEYFLFKSQH
jgi:hypothetical protein